MRIIIYPLIILVSLSCKKEIKSNFFNKDCMVDFKMPYQDVELRGNYVFSSSDLGPFKIVAGFNHNVFNIGIGQTFVTSEPTVAISNQHPIKRLMMKTGLSPEIIISEEYKNFGHVEFWLSKFKKTENISLEEFIDSSFFVGNLLMNKSQIVLDTSKVVEQNFEILIIFSNCENDGSGTVAVSGMPEQQGNLECASFTKNYEADSIHYQIQLKFDNISLKLVENLHLNDGEIGYDFKIPR
jgi:hypothetical protein